MELRNLRTFQQVAERNSFTAAAAALGYSQSTVSFQIKQLEEELGCLLFERINHTLTLTDRGRSTLDYAQSVLHLTDEFKQSMDTSQTPSGFVHIVAPDSLCEEMVARSYRKFYSRYPAVSLKFSTGDTSDMFHMLDRNEADVILTLDAHVYSREYIIAKEEQISTHFVTGKNSPFAGKKDLSIRDLIDTPFVLTEKGIGYRRLLDNALEEMSIELHPILELGRTDIITAVLREINSISFLPDFVTAEGVRRGELVYLDVKDMEVDVWKQLIYHRNKWISRGMRAFLNYAMEWEFCSQAQA